MATRKDGMIDGFPLPAGGLEKVFGVPEFERLSALLDEVDGQYRTVIVRDGVYTGQKSMFIRELELRHGPKSELRRYALTDFDRRIFEGQPNPSRLVVEERSLQAFTIDAAEPGKVLFVISPSGIELISKEVDETKALEILGAFESDVDATPKQVLEINTELQRLATKDAIPEFGSHNHQGIYNLPPFARKRLVAGLNGNYNYYDWAAVQLLDERAARLPIPSISTILAFEMHEPESWNQPFDHLSTVCYLPILEPGQTPMLKRHIAHEEHRAFTPPDETAVHLVRHLEEVGPEDLADVTRAEAAQVLEFLRF